MVVGFWGGEEKPTMRGGDGDLPTGLEALEGMMILIFRLGSFARSVDDNFCVMLGL